MADVIFAAVTEENGDDKNFDTDATYRQCLADSRRMLRDREYWALFGPDESFGPLLQ
jgi:hypothetical protein